MKKIYILLIFLIVNLKMFGENFNYFRHINGSEDTDYEKDTGSLLIQYLIL